MIKFGRVYYRNMDYGYMLLIDNISSLISYHMFHTISIYGDVFSWINSKDSNKHLSKTHEKDEDHARTPYRGMFMMMCKNESYVGKSFTKEIIPSLLDDVLDTQYNIIKDGNMLLINRRGGYFYSTPENVIITDIIESDEYIFPNYDEIRYIQWDGGVHWYAKIGNNDVVDDAGNQKWNSKEDAERAVNVYIKKYHKQDMGT